MKSASFTVALAEAAKNPGQVWTRQIGKYVVGFLFNQHLLLMNMNGISSYIVEASDLDAIWTCTKGTTLDQIPWQSN